MSNKARIAELKEKINDFDPSKVFSEDDYEALLNESHQHISLLGVFVPMGTAIRKCDEVHFEQLYQSYCSSADPDQFDEYRELVNELEDLEINL